MSNIKVVSEEDQKVLGFISLLKDISFSLEVLAQIQACVGGLSMENRSGKTFERKIQLDIFIAQIEYERMGNK